MERANDREEFLFVNRVVELGSFELEGVEGDWAGMLKVRSKGASGNCKLLIIPGLV